MANQIIWTDEETAQNLPLTCGFSPVNHFDTVNRTFTDQQEIDEESGLPIWQAEAVFRTGWGANIEAFNVRVVSREKPDIALNPMRIVKAMGMANLSQGAQSTLSSSSPTSTPISRTAKVTRGD